MFSPKEINLINKILTDKEFILIYTSHGIPNQEIKYKFTIAGYKKMISVGNEVDYLRVNVKLTDVSGDFLLNHFATESKMIDFTQLIEKQLYHLYHKISIEINNFLSIFNYDITRIVIESIIYEPKSGEVNESTMSRQAIRSVVRDVTNILKTKKIGNFYLPEDDYYQFEGYPFDFSVELTVLHDKKINGFLINAFYVTDEEVVEIIIKYNPNNLNKNLYKIIGELNEIIAHELEHGNQEFYGELLHGPDDESSISYYLNQNEIDAQVKGFNRLAKLTKTPFDKIVTEWFETHRDIHQLKDEEINIVKKELISGRKSLSKFK
jgi:hypothetical protein